MALCLVTIALRNSFSSFLPLIFGRQCQTLLFHLAFNIPRFYCSENFSCLGSLASLSCYAPASFICAFEFLKLLVLKTVVFLCCESL